MAVPCYRYSSFLAQQCYVSHSRHVERPGRSCICHMFSPLCAVLYTVYTDAASMLYSEHMRKRM